MGMFEMGRSWWFTAHADFKKLRQRDVFVFKFFQLNQDDVVFSRNWLF
jgi:hypothetical protein